MSANPIRAEESLHIHICPGRLVEVRMMTETYHVILGLASDATQEQIRAAYRQ